MYKYHHLFFKLGSLKVQMMIAWLYTDGLKQEVEEEEEEEEEEEMEEEQEAEKQEAPGSTVHTNLRTIADSRREVIKLT